MSDPQPSKGFAVPFPPKSIRVLKRPMNKRNTTALNVSMSNSITPFKIPRISVNELTPYVNGVMDSLIDTPQEKDYVDIVLNDIFR